MTDHFLSVKMVVCVVVVEQGGRASPLQCKQTTSKTLQPVMAPTPIFMYSCVYQNWPACAAVSPPSWWEKLFPRLRRKPGFHETPADTRVISPQCAAFRMCRKFSNHFWFHL